MIRLERAQVTLGQNKVIDGVSLDFSPGRISVIIGPNGAGKTSLLRAMAGLISPSAGQIQLDGSDIAQLPLAERARRIGYLPQAGSPAWALTVRELVALGRLPHRGPFAGLSSEDNARIEEALTATDLVDLAERTVDSLSGGECARAQFARVLAGGNDWILADEPLANLDPPHQRDLLNLLRTAAVQGKGVVVVLHQLSEAAMLADDVIILKQGRVLRAGPRSAALTTEALSSAFDMALTVHSVEEQLVVLPTARSLAPDGRSP